MTYLDINSLSVGAEVAIDYGRGAQLVCQCGVVVRDTRNYIEILLTHDPDKRQSANIRAEKIKVFKDEATTVPGHQAPVYLLSAAGARRAVELGQATLAQ